jgi:Ion channel
VASHVRERSLTALVILEGLLLFVIAPLTAAHGVPFTLVAIVIALNVIAVLAVVWHIRSAVAAVVLATVIEFAAIVLRIVKPTTRTESLDFAAALVLVIALTVVLSTVVFGSGRVTIHRILGAIAIYFNVAAAFALGYRMIDALGPNMFASSSPMNHPIADLIYFSFAVITTTGFGDIVPLDPFARSLSNLESVFGQLFPATLLARLITLEIEHRREERR